MTDSAPRDPDQLASDLADGLLPPDEAARLRADPQVAVRVARIEALRSALRSTPPAPPPPGGLDRMVGAAVDAALPAASAAASRPSHLQAVRPPVHQAPPTPRRRSAAPWLAAAAALVVGLAMAGLLTRGSSDSDDDMSSSAAPTEDRSEQSADDGGAGAGDGSSESGSDVASGGEPGAATEAEGPADEAGEAGEESTGSGVDVLSADLGAFDSVDELADRVRAERAAAGEALPPVSPNLEAACPGHRAEGDTARGTSTYTAEAEYQGAPVTVHVYETGGGLRLVATDASCDDVVDVPYQD